MAKIKANTSEMNTLASRLSGFRQQTNEALSLVNRTSNNLDWQVSSRERINTRISQVKTRLNKQINLMERYSGVVYGGISQFDTANNNIRNKSNTLIYILQKMNVMSVLFNTILPFLFRPGIDKVRSLFGNRIPITPVMLGVLKSVNTKAIETSSKSQEEFTGGKVEYVRTHFVDWYYSNNMKPNLKSYTIGRPGDPDYFRNAVGINGIKMLEGVIGDGFNPWSAVPGFVELGADVQLMFLAEQARRQANENIEKFKKLCREITNLPEITISPDSFNVNIQTSAKVISPNEQLWSPASYDLLKNLTPSQAKELYDYYVEAQYQRTLEQEYAKVLEASFGDAQSALQNEAVDWLGGDSAEKAVLNKTPYVDTAMDMIGVIDHINDIRQICKDAEAKANAFRKEVAALSRNY